MASSLVVVLVLLVCADIKESIVFTTGQNDNNLVRFLSMDVTMSDGQGGHLLALPPAAGLFYPVHQRKLEIFFLLPCLRLFFADAILLLVSFATGGDF